MDNTWFSETIALPRVQAFDGLWVPLVTPFRDGRVDYAAAVTLAQHLSGQGIDGLVLCGTTGEGPALDTAEKSRLIDSMAGAVDLPLVMGLEGPSTARLVEEVTALRAAPLAGYLLPAPSYVRPSEDGIFRHMMAIADAAARPVILYDIPARTGVHMSAGLVTRLAATGAFPAIKACGLSAIRLKALLAIPGLKVLCGDDNWLYQALSLGAHGAIMASAHIRTADFVDIVRAARRGDSGTAARLFGALQPLTRMLFTEPNPAPVKAALSHQGWIRNELRLPLLPVTAETQAALHSLLHGLPAPEDLHLHLADKSFK